MLRRSRLALIALLFPLLVLPACGEPDPTPDPEIAAQDEAPAPRKRPRARGRRGPRRDEASAPAAAVVETRRGTILRALRKGIVVQPEGASDKLQLARSEQTTVSGLATLWHDLDVGYEVEVEYERSRGRSTARRIEVLSLGEAPKPTLAELQAELGAEPAPASR